MDVDYPLEIFRIDVNNKPTMTNFHRFTSTWLTKLTLAVAAITLASCTTPTKLSRPKYSINYDPPATQPTNRSAVKIKLSRVAQRLYVVEGNKVLLATPVSVGTAKDPTPLGVYPIRAKKFDRRRVSSPGAGYPMTFWMEFYNPAYGMHWGFVKPYPCTMGCVRIPLKSARKIFNMVSVGTLIDIKDHHPEDLTIGKTLPVLDDTTLPDPPMSYMRSSKVFSDAAEGKFYAY